MIVAAGVGKNKNVLKAIEEIDFEVLQTESEDDLVDMLFSGKVDAAIRGSLGASKVMPILRSKYPKISRASYINLKGNKFLFAPVGIDEGDFLNQKLQLAEQGSEFLKSLGIKPHIAVLSAGRPTDKGRSSKIDDSIDEGELLTSKINERSIYAKHYYILIEEAIADGSNFIIAPDGICGNLIFRTLVFLGGAKSYGAITLGMKEIYIDTSRSQNIEGYKRALKFANFLASSKK
jgi:putative methanogen marker protein 4